METLNFLAKLWGFYLIIVPLALLLRPRHIKQLFALAEQPAALFLLGMFNVVIGTAILLAYNTFDGGLKTIITILGWVVLVKGLAYLFFPKWSLSMIETWKKNDEHWVPIALVASIIIGCVLVFMGIVF